MVKVLIDTSGAEQGNRQNYEGPTPPAGIYKVILKSGWWGMSKGGNGKEPQPMLTAVLEIRDTDTKAKFNGYPIWVRITHQPSTLWRMQQLFTALGQPAKASLDVGDKDSQFGKVVNSIGNARFGHAMLMAKTRIDSYQGKTRLDVDELTPLPGVEIDETANFEDEEVATEDAFNQSANDDPWDNSAEVPF